VATVLFPALSRLAARGDREGMRGMTANGMRQICLLLIPAAAATLVLAEPITRLVYEHGEFGPADTDRVASALFWFAFSLPFSGINLLLTRTFFSLRRPWIPTGLAVASLLVNAIVSLALYGPFGIAGIVIGTVASTAATTLTQGYMLRRELAGRLEARRTLTAAALITLAAALGGALAYGCWWGLDEVLGRGLVAQTIAVTVALAAGLALYAGTLLLVRLPEALYVFGLIARRRS
jgi:putative peptidoglycan lipid II flippase